MGDVIRGPWPDAVKLKRVVLPRSAVVQVEKVRVVQTAPLPDLCAQCGTALAGDSPPEGKKCPSCGRLNSHASLGADY